MPRSGAPRLQIWLSSKLVLAPVSPSPPKDDRRQPSTSATPERLQGSGTRSTQPLTRVPAGQVLTSHRVGCGGAVHVTACAAAPLWRCLHSCGAR